MTGHAVKFLIVLNISMYNQIDDANSMLVVMEELNSDPYITRHALVEKHFGVN